MTGPRNPNNRNSGGTVSARAIRALILCFLFPPIGLIYMWRALVFPLRGRILMTLVALVETTLLFVWGFFGLITWSSMPDTVRPQPGSSVAVTAAPTDDTVNALSNIDELISTATPAADAAADATADATAEPSGD